MTPVLAILKALAHAIRRDLGSFESLKLNNLVLFMVLLAWGAFTSGVEPVSAEPLMLLFTLLILFPLSADPLGKIPADRLRVWPLSLRQRFMLRIGSVLLSPVVWLAMLILCFSRRWMFAVAFLMAAVGCQVLLLFRFAAPPLVKIPQLPGKLGGLVSHNMRQMLTVLDTYAATLLALGGVGYRLWAPAYDRMAPPISAMLVALTLSTYGQCLFGLDLESSALLRYRLLPLRGWEILLAKDLAFLGILTLLILPLDVPAGLTFGLVALSVGHHTSLLVRAPQQKWRFTGGRVLAGALQAILGAVLAFAELRQGAWVCGPVAIAYTLSLWFYGRIWDQQRGPLAAIV